MITTFFKKIIIVNDWQPEVAASSSQNIESVLIDLIDQQLLTLVHRQDGLVVYDFHNESGPNGETFVYFLMGTNIVQFTRKIKS